jgi:hypothetical protein
MGSVQWVWKGIEAVGPRVKAARRKVPKVDIAGLLRKTEAASLHDAVDACDTSADTLDRALCMGSYDPLSSLNAEWTWRSAQTARSKVPKVNIGGLWAAEAANLHEEFDSCDVADDTLSRALCIEDQDPFSRGSANWVLSRLETADAAGKLSGTSSKHPKSESTRGWLWRKMMRTPTESSPSEKDI